MSILFIRPEDHPEVLDKVVVDGAQIAAELGKIGARFERWSAESRLDADAGEAAILTAYQSEVARLKREHGYQSADVVRLVRGTPNTAPMREKFLSEHCHSEDEVRFFVEGSGSFYLRGVGSVYQVLCERDDLISVPAQTRHWFDMGTDPHFCAIRLFTNPTGWVAQFTGDAIAARFPTHDDALDWARTAR
jgi:1,2-dihydroxy-3-keto-5-methylthiopentene dioxygenase